MTRPWLTLPPLLADHARTARLLHLTPAELRDLHRPPPESERCWRTTPEGRAWQARLETAINATGGTVSDPRWTDETETHIADAFRRCDPYASTQPDDYHRLNARAVLKYLADTGLLVQPGGETCTWSLPAEPGQEVKAVCTSRGEIWRRGTGYFAHLWTRERLGVVGGIDTRTWLSLLRDGPLTDATQEAPHA